MWVIEGDLLITQVGGSLKDKDEGAPLKGNGSGVVAFDKLTGKEVGAVYMPAPQSGSPMTYLHEGKQYIIVAISGGNYSGEYIAFALPSAPQRTSTGQ